MAPTDAWKAMAWYLEEKSKEVTKLQLDLTDSWANNPSEESLKVIDRAELNEAEAFILSMKDNDSYDGEDEQSATIRNSMLYKTTHKETPTDTPNKHQELSALVEDVRSALKAYEDAITRAGKKRRDGALDAIREQVESFAAQVREGGANTPLIAESITGMEASAQWLQQRVNSLAAKESFNAGAASGQSEARQERSNIKARSSRGQFAKAPTDESGSTTLGRNQYTTRSSAQHTAGPADDEDADDEHDDVLVGTSFEGNREVENDESSSIKARSGSGRFAKLPSTKYSRLSLPRKQDTTRRSAQYSTTPAAEEDDGERRSDVPTPDGFEEDNGPDNGKELQNEEDLDDRDYAGNGGGDDGDQGRKASTGRRDAEEHESEDDACSLSSGSSNDSSDDDNDDSSKPDHRTGRGNFDKDRAPRYTPAETEKLVLLYGKFFGRKQLPDGVTSKIRRAFNKWLREKSVMSNGKQVKRRKGGLRQQARKLWADGWRLEDGKAIRPSAKPSTFKYDPNALPGGNPGKRPAYDSLGADEPLAQKRSARVPPGAGALPPTQRGPREEHFITDESGQFVTVGADDPRHDINRGRNLILPSSTASPHPPAPAARFAASTQIPQQSLVNPPTANPPPRLPTPPSVPPPGPEREAWLQRLHEAEADLRQRQTELPLSRIIAQNKKARHDMLYGFHRPGCGCGKP